MIVVTLMNQKGGVGKTSCTHHLAGAVAASGRRVLLLDNDPQASLTQGFWGPPATRAINPAESIAAIYAGDQPAADDVVKPTGIAGIDLVAGSKSATRYNVPDIASVDLDRQLCLRTFLEDAIEPGAYDLVLVDCPPNLHLCSWAALAAAGYLIVPTQAEEYGAQGLYDVEESVALVRASVNPQLRLLGYLLTMVTKKKIHLDVETGMRGIYGDEVFAAMVPDSIDYPNAISFRMPVSLHRPKGVAAKSMAAIAAEMWSRIESNVATMNHRAEVA